MHAGGFQLHPLDVHSHSTSKPSSSPPFITLCQAHNALPITSAFRFEVRKASNFSKGSKPGQSDLNINPLKKMKRLTQSTALQAKTQTGNSFIIMHQRLVVVTSYPGQAERGNRSAAQLLLPGSV